MGWTGTHKEKGQSLDEFFSNELEDDNYKFVSKGYKKGEAYYRAMTDLRTDKVFAMVILVHFKPSDYFNITYKDMTESMGPCESQCPKYILDMLTDTDSEWANEWRGRCRANLAREAETKKKQKALEFGMVIRFKNPIGFSQGRNITDFKIVKNPRAKRATKMLFALGDNGGFYARVPNWQKMEYEVVQ